MTRSTGRSGGHLLARASVDIEAPAAAAWAVLTDFSRYPEWNPFTPEVEAELRPGAPVRLAALVGGLRFVERGEVVEVEPGSAIRWHVFPMPRALVWGDRVQRVEALGEGRCRFSSEDRLRGLLAPVVALLVGSLVTRGFEAAGAALKRRVEAGPNSHNPQHSQHSRRPETSG
jgi:hypothetical protein